MVSKFFYFKVIIQILLILISGFIAFYLYFDSKYVLLPINIGFLIIFQSIILIRYINRFNKSIAYHLGSLINNDFTHVKNLSLKNKSLSGLNETLKVIYKKLETSEIEKTVEYQYHRYSIDHVNVGLISFAKESGEIKYMNKAAKDLLEIQTIRFIGKIKDTSKELYKIIQTLNVGQAKLFKFRTEVELLQLSIKIAEFKLLEETIKLVSIQNIKKEIEESELESWQKLIRILTHEIMNSVAPIVSATKSLSNFLTVNGVPKRSSEVSDKLIKDSVLGLEAINTRSDGLLEFVNQYRNLTNLPQANFSTFKIIDLFNQVNVFLKTEFEINNIDFEYNIANNEMMLTADFKLIEQTLINIILNSIHALESKEHKKIKLIAYIINDCPVIEVYDNGKGIPVENMDKIFIPFFTTREGGSGIGLSLARQIMQLHNGNISVSSKINEGTRFTIKL